MNLLIVDDSAVYLRLLRAMLEAEGHTVFEAENGIQALAMLAREKVDAVISDLLMPQMDGFRLCREVRTDERLRQLPFIVHTTTYTSPSDEKLCLNLGADRFLRKPASSSEILNALQEVMTNPRRHPTQTIEPPDEGLNLMKEYSERLVAKLEEKNVELAGNVETLRISEERFRNAFDHTNVAMVLTDLDNRFVRVNDAFARMFGYSREEILQLSMADITHPEDVTESDVRRQALLAGEVPNFQMENRYLSKDGRVLWGLTNVSLIRDAAGAPQQYVGQVQDITERKRSEEVIAKYTERLRILHQIDRALIAGEEPTAIATAALVPLRELLGVPRAIVNLFDLANGEVEWLAAAGRHQVRVGPGIRYSIQFMGEVEALRRGEPQFIDTHALPPSPEVDALLASGIRAYAVVPMIAEGELVGALSFGGESMPLSPEQISIAQEVATQFAVALTQARLHERVKRQEQELRSAFDHTNVAMVLTDLGNRFVRVNDAFARMFGYSREEILKLSMADITHPEDVAASLAGRKKLVAGERPFFQIEKRYLHKDGSVLWGLTNVSLVRDSQNNPLQYFGQVQDITERKQTEVMLRERSVHVELSADVAMAFTSSESLREILQHCVESMVRNLDVAFARVWMLNEATNVLELQASAGLYTHIDGPHARVAVGKYMIGLIAQERKPHLTNEVLHDPRVSDPEWTKREGMIAFAGYPLLLEDRVVGVMAMFARKNLIGTTLATMASVANQIALGIDRKLNEEALRQSERRFQELTAHIHQVLWMIDAKESKVLYVSPGYETVWGRSIQSLIDDPQSYLEGIHPLDQEMMARQSTVMFRTGHIDAKCRILRPDGSMRWVWIRGYPVADQGQVVRLVGVIEDITEQKSLEMQFQQAQKMDAIGQLAGGVAHDFNNLLTIIMGYAELLIESHHPDDPAQEFLAEIKRAGERSASLTRQLLAFSRKQVLAPKILDLNGVIRDTEKMLRRLIGENIEFTTLLHPQLDSIKADPGQLEQVLVNLAVNARDAMPDGGKLTIETNNVQLDEEYAETHVGVRPGPYVMLALSDSGVGMTEEIKRRIFEPFFTTKEVGKGTGLGLAVVHGIAKQSDGHVEVFSELGIGTCFKIYLPRVQQPAKPRSSFQGLAPAPRGTETILLVEDEEALRGLARHALGGCGYTVLVAGNSEEALSLCANHQGPIHLLLTDVVMPGLGGRQLAKQVIAQFPQIKVLYMSGYTDDTVVRHGILHKQVNFLQKPFSPLALAKKVRQVLN